MQVSKWGNSLAIRIPAEVVEALGLKEGDEVKISVASKDELRVDHDDSRDEAIRRMRQRGWILPAGFKFNREEANER